MTDDPEKDDEQAHIISSEIRELNKNYLSEMSKQLSAAATDREKAEIQKLMDEALNS